MTIGERIKQRRLELGLTQTELAQKLGNKTRASVCNVEKDKEDLTTARIRQYAEALETTPAYLMGWDINSVHDKLLEAYVSNADREAAMSMYKKYQNLPDDVRAAVDLLLKSSKQ